MAKNDQKGRNMGGKKCKNDQNGPKCQKIVKQQERVARKPKTVAFNGKNAAKFGQIWHKNGEKGKIITNSKRQGKKRQETGGKMG